MQFCVLILFSRCNVTSSSVCTKEIIHYILFLCSLYLTPPNWTFLSPFKPTWFYPCLQFWKTWVELFSLFIYFMFLCCFVIHFCSGFPVWLRDIPGIEFRTDNEPYKVEEPLSISSVWEYDDHYSFLYFDPLILRMFLQAEMQTFVTKIVDIMKKEKLYSWQGGPIILQQVWKLFSKFTYWCFFFLEHVG